MILQYKGFNNNWCYEEAETVTQATVWVGKETRDYRNGGERHKMKYLPEYTQGRSKEEVDLYYAKEMHEAVDRLIRKETGCSGEIVYHINKSLDEMENVTVVTLNDRGKDITRVFDNGVYLLNNKGQTVQRLA